MNGPSFKRKAEEARKWWKELQPFEDGSKRGDRAALARLRRASSWIDAAGESQTIALFHNLNANEREFSRIAILAAVLAHVRSDTGPDVPVARTIGALPGKGEEAALKPPRLRRLLTAKDEEAIFTGFRRLVAIMDGKANAGDLAWNILTWEREKTRMKFAFDYWHGPAPEPVADNTAA
jgi:CRISPR system Cascade subunit CasB